MSKIHSYDQIYSKYSSKIYRFVNNKISNIADVEDISQNIWLNTYIALEHNPPIQNMGAWIYTIAKNSVISWNRNKKSKLSELKSDSLEFIVKNDPLLNKIEVEEMNHKLKIVYCAIEHLPENYKEILKLQFQEGKGTKYISEEKGITRGSVKNIVYRSIKRLRKEFV